MAKVISIKIPGVESEMLNQIQKRNSAYKDLTKMILEQIRKEYQKQNPSGK